MSQGGPPRWPPGSPHHPHLVHRSPSPFRGPPPPRPGWASPIPPGMTQSPPPFLIRPMVAGYNRGTPSPVPGSPIPPPPRWSHSPMPVGGVGTPIPPNFHHPPPPHPLVAPRPFFRPIIPSPTPPPLAGQYPPMPQPSYHFQPQIPSQLEQQSDNIAMEDLRPSFDVEIVYPPGMDPDVIRRRMTPQTSEIDDEECGPTTAEIIAAQSQDYVDERLAEYQATIQHLQGLPTIFFRCMSDNLLTV